MLIIPRPLRVSTISAIANYGDLLMRLGLDRGYAQMRINALFRGGEVRDLVTD